MFPILGESYITQQFGDTAFSRSPAGKRAYKNFPNGIHPGTDHGTRGKPLEVIALVDGKIVRASMDGGWGNHVELEGIDGWRRQYAHLSAISCKVGQLVKRGDVLGKVGNTGASQGTHLHYGCRKSKAIGWDYRDPSSDFVERVEAQPPKIKGRLIKANDEHLPNIYVYNGKSRFRIPDMETLTFLFPKENYELVETDYMVKIPELQSLPSMK